METPKEPQKSPERNLNANLSDIHKQAIQAVNHYKYNLSTHEVEFCRLLIMGFQGNDKYKAFPIGQQGLSYAVAFDRDISCQRDMNSCVVMAINLIKHNPDIDLYNRDLLVAMGFNDNSADAELNSILHKGKNDQKLKAYELYCKLRKRIGNDIPPGTVININMSVVDKNGVEVKDGLRDIIDAEEELLNVDNQKK